MPQECITKVTALRGQPEIPGDKSMSHRALIFGALAQGTTTISHLLEGEDVLSTLSCLRQLGVSIEKIGIKYMVHGLGGFHFKKSVDPLDCGNSGTTMRLFMGLLASQPIESVLVGDASLTKRPMKRVSLPLSQMGATYTLTQDNYPPVKMMGGKLSSIDYSLPVASAQIKSAIILAALGAEGSTIVRGQIRSRDHTEKMLAHFGVTVHDEKDFLLVEGGQNLIAKDFLVPGDPSTAAFWLGAACMIPGSKIVLKNISLNPTRLGFVEVLKRMGAKVDFSYDVQEGEPMGTLTAVGGPLKGVHVTKEMIPAMVDEIPLLAALATQAEGETLIEGAEELRVKESDRIESVAVNLRAMGAKVEVRPDGFRIHGPQKLHGASIQTFHDHRIAMAFSILGLVAEGQTEIQNPECVAISYPHFFETLRQISQ